MHLVDDLLLLSPTDLVGFLACEHLTQLDLEAGRGKIVRPQRVDPELELLARMGQAHEAAQLDQLRSARGATEIGNHPETLAGLRAAEAETLAAMRSGAEVIYQAAFFDGRWRGRADFLLRVERASELGDWSYEVADAKLARSVKVGALLQMCEYSHQVTRLQGRAPECMHVYLGTGVQESHRVGDYESYFRAARARFEASVDGGPESTYPDPVDHCGRCAWADVCDQQRRADDHLSLVAGMRRDHSRRMFEAGVTTVAELAIAPAEPVAGIGDGPWERLRHQAALQIVERTTGEHVHELIDCAGAGLGLAALPPPSPGDLFFDIEGDPFVEDGGLEYLFGITEVAGRAPRFHAFWGHDRAGEKAAFEGLVDFIIERLDRDPSLHVYHYAQYEQTALKKLMGRHGTREDEVDRLLRSGAFVDLYQVIRQGVRTSRESYSLKSLEVFYMAPRRDEIADAGGSVVAYEQWRDTRDQAVLDAIAVYNERDCESTWRLRGWLEQCRDQWLQARGSPLPRPEPRTGEASEAVLQASAETQELVEQLTDGLPAGSRTPSDAARCLLAQLLDWHRREAKAEWWAFFERQAMTDDELKEDREAIGDITHVRALRKEKRSTVHRYSFDGTQEHKLDIGSEPCDPRTGKGCGEVIGLDDDAGIIDLRRGPSLEGVEHPRSLVPGRPIPTVAMRDALRRVARGVLSGGVDGAGGHRATRDLLIRTAPRVAGIAAGSVLVGAVEDPVDAAVRLVGSLEHSYLAVQGPPGAGKTHTGARIILDQVRRGHRVGVCATTHRATGELLSAVCRMAAEAGVELSILQKCSEHQSCDAPMVRHTAHNQNIDAGLRDGSVDVVAGTQWLFSRPELEGLLDVLVIDEAGQMSLANAFAAGCAADNLVLLGDPQQLAQPAKGIHPKGAAVSSLEHALGGEQTIAPGRGVFLATTRRMHPDVCAFISTAFYEGRLLSYADCSRQRVGGDGPLAGTGLRAVLVPHSGNRTWSPEEVMATGRLFDALLGRPWTDQEGCTRPIGVSDILVVAPYNLQVRRLREGLVAGARVGTVDMFQGQEAAVSIFAMATSSAEDVPRNLEFLFSRNRLNVAVSRARAISVVVCSPLLFQVGCRTPDQLRMVSALCRFAEMAAAAA